MQENWRSRTYLAAFRIIVLFLFIVKQATQCRSHLGCGELQVNKGRVATEEQYTRRGRRDILSSEARNQEVVQRTYTHIRRDKLQ